MATARWHVASLLVAGITLGGSSPVLAQAAAPNGAITTSARPDFSGVDQFWSIAATLARDVEPSESQWQALLRTPGYRLAAENLDGLRDAIDLALKPSRHAEFARRSAGSDDGALMLRHIAAAWRDRAALRRFADSLARAPVLAEAVTMAQRYLPGGATQQGAPPPVAVAIFKDDNFSLPDGIVVDLIAVRYVPLTITLAHEFHHSYVNRMAPPLPPGSDTAKDEGFRTALHDLRNEGIADLIDKPYPFHSPNPGLAAYAQQYNSEYEQTPARMRRLDSLLSAASAGPDQAAALQMPMTMLFWSNGHPNGAYLAREILQTFGVDSIRAAATDPAEFLRLFAAAERVHGRPDPLSPKAWLMVDRLDARYWKRR